MLPLQRPAVIERLLSASEYFHASFGNGPDDPTPFVVTYIFEGDGPDFVPEAWQAALEQAGAANPGSHMRLVGTSLFARWKGDGQSARLRIIEQTDWDGMSQHGGGFFATVPLSLDGGPTVELLLVNKSPRGKLVIIRALHCVMDGRGTLHFLADVFRALRGEALLGTNTALVDADLLDQVTPRKPPEGLPERQKTDRLTGPPAGEDGADEWRRVTLHTSGHNILGRVAQIMAEYVHQRGDDPVVFSVPVDLRRHAPGLLSTANFFGVLLVPLAKGEDSRDFRRKLDVLLEARMDVVHLRGQNLAKLLPRSWLHSLAWWIVKLYRTRSPIITAGISNQGRFPPGMYSCPGFQARTFIGTPYPGRSEVVLMGMGDQIEMIVRMPRVFASNGRLDDFIAFVLRRLGEIDAS